MAFRVYPKTAVLVLKTIPYTKDGVLHPERDMPILLGEELPDGSREGRPVMAQNDDWVAVYVEKAK